MDAKEVYDYIIRIQAIAKIGLVYSKDPYAITNYKEINRLSLEMLEKFVEVKFDRPNYFERNIYPTPNVSVRTLIFNSDRTKVLMVKEVKEQEYSFPGGWADLYDSPADTAKNESLQEAGAVIDIVRLVGIMNRTPFKSPTATPEYVVVFEGRIKELHKEHEYETDDVNFFDINNLPPLCKKVSEGEIKRMIDAALSGKTVFD